MRGSVQMQIWILLRSATDCRSSGIFLTRRVGEVRKRECATARTRGGCVAQRTLCRDSEVQFTRQFALPSTPFRGESAPNRAADEAPKSPAKLYTINRFE